LITINHPLDDGFHGGRCEVGSPHCKPVKLIYDFKSKGVKGKYMDAVSLYPTVIYYDRYPVGHPTKNCLLIIYAKNETTQVHKALDIFGYVPRHKAHNMPQKLTKINY